MYRQNTEQLLSKICIFSGLYNCHDLNCRNVLHREYIDVLYEQTVNALTNSSNF